MPQIASKYRNTLFGSRPVRMAIKKDAAFLKNGKSMVSRLFRLVNSSGTYYNVANKTMLTAEKRL